MKIAAIYARVSSEKQKDENTIVSQIEALTEFAQQEGYTVPPEWIFRDEGYSGSLLVRPGLEKLRDLAAEGHTEVILVYSPDRLSRKYAYQVLLIEEFARHGVEVVFIKSPRAHNPEDELLLQFQGMIAEYERAQIIERSRRGKRYRARNGAVSVLSGAPYGYRYVPKTDQCEAYYQIIESEAQVVQEAFRLFTESRWAIGAIARHLSDQGIPTRTGKTRWDRSVIWAMLKNPAYNGTACYGKTEQVERKKITRPLRRKGGYSPRSSANRERAQEDWIKIPVPALINTETFDLAQELLKKNQKLSLRRTKEPTLLQGLLICNECGYAYYRTSTRTSKRKIYYYRCLGSDDYRYPNGRICDNRPLRQDELDEAVWEQIVELLENPELIRQEIDRRVREALSSNPTQARKEKLVKEQTRIKNSIDKLLDAYQEDLLSLRELRQRIPALKRRETALTAELQNLDAQQVSQDYLATLAGHMEQFVAQLRENAKKLDVLERQRILRILVKEILIGKNTVKIRHSIPVPKTPSGREPPGYLLRWGSHDAALRRVRDRMQHPAICFQDARFQPFLDETQKSLIIDPLLQHANQPCVVDVIEEAFDVCFNYEAVAAKAKLMAKGFHRIAGSHSRPIAVAAWQKVFFENRAQDQCDCDLEQLVLQNRQSKRTKLVFALGYPLAQHQLCPVAALLETLNQCAHVRGEVRAVFLGRHTIHAGRRVFAEKFPTVLEKFFREHRRQVAKPVLLFAFRLVGYALQGGLHGVSDFARSVHVVLCRLRISVSPFPMCSSYARVGGSLVHRVLWADPTPRRSSVALLVVKRTYLLMDKSVEEESTRSLRFLKFLYTRATLLSNPGRPYGVSPKKKTCDAFVLASGGLKPWPSASTGSNGAISSLRKCGLPCGSCAALCTPRMFPWLSTDIDRLPCRIRNTR